MAAIGGLGIQVAFSLIFLEFAAASTQTSKITSQSGSFSQGLGQNDVYLKATPTSYKWNYYDMYTYIYNYNVEL